MAENNLMEMLNAALRDLREADRVDGCKHCKHYNRFADACEKADFLCSDCMANCPCKTCYYTDPKKDNWEWRGVKEEEHDGT